MTQNIRPTTGIKRGEAHRKNVQRENNLEKTIEELRTRRDWACVEEVEEWLEEKLYEAYYEGYKAGHIAAGIESINNKKDD